MAMELGPMGVRVNAVAPGFINTPTNSKIVEQPEAVEEVVTIPLTRIGEPEEVPDVVAFLMSEESKYVSGSVVEVHGGAL